MYSAPGNGLCTITNHMCECDYNSNKYDYISCFLDRWFNTFVCKLTYEISTVLRYNYRHDTFEKINAVMCTRRIRLVDLTINNYFSTTVIRGFRLYCQYKTFEWTVVYIFMICYCGTKRMRRAWGGVTCGRVYGVRVRDGVKNCIRLDAYRWGA